jgi:hypothetical protein
MDPDDRLAINCRLKTIPELFRIYLSGTQRASERVEGTILEPSEVVPRVWPGVREQGWLAVQTLCSQWGHPGMQEDHAFKKQQYRRAQPLNSVSRAFPLYLSAQVSQQKIGTTALFAPWFRSLPYSLRRRACKANQPGGGLAEQLVRPADLFDPSCYFARQCAQRSRRPRGAVAFAALAPRRSLLVSAFLSHTNTTRCAVSDSSIALTRR